MKREVKLKVENGCSESLRRIDGVVIEMMKMMGFAGFVAMKLKWWKEEIGTLIGG